MKFPAFKARARARAQTRAQTRARLYARAPDAARAVVVWAAAMLLGAACTAGAAPAQAVRLAQGVSYVNGGIGVDEARQIESQAAGYNLRLVFSEGRTNEFAADVHLRIADQAGHPVLTLDDAGPLTDVQLPPGRYQVDCRFGQLQQHHSVELRQGQPTNLYLHFARDDAR